jgi:hypothetical protein
MHPTKSNLSQRDWLVLGATTFLTSGLVTGLSVMLAVVAGLIKI